MLGCFDYRQAEEATQSQGETGRTSPQCLGRDAAPPHLGEGLPASRLREYLSVVSRWPGLSHMFS